MLRLTRPALFAFSITAFLAFAGCKDIARMMPASTIDNPKEGEPEWVIYQYIGAALMENTDDGYKKIRPLLHSEILDSVAAESHFRQNIFEASHRKALYFSIDDKTGAYKKDYDDDSEKPGQIIKIFVVNEKSDMPTPCRLKRDPKFDNAWRISNQCSL